VAPLVRPEAAEEAANDELPEVPQVAYRVSGDLQVRAMELEQEVGEQAARLRAMEREVFAARRALRNQRRLRVLGAGGLGALVGTIIGSALYAFLGSPSYVSGATAIGFVLALLGAGRWDPPDDNFPTAPPPRLTGG
jgi:hypothetical protein